jgi:hypothetical protein
VSWREQRICIQQLWSSPSPRQRQRLDTNLCREGRIRCGEQLTMLYSKQLSTSDRGRGVQNRSTSSYDRGVGNTVSCSWQLLRCNESSADCHLAFVFLHWPSHATSYCCTIFGISYLDRHTYQGSGCLSGGTNLTAGVGIQRRAYLNNPGSTAPRTSKAQAVSSGHSEPRPITCWAHAPSGRFEDVLLISLVA